MYLFIEENPNTSGDERVFSTSGAQRRVDKVHIAAPGTKEAVWCAITGVQENGAFEPATAQLIEDSSDGTAWLVFGGDWGLRLKPENYDGAWSLTDKQQWGLPFLVLDGSGSSIHFHN